MKKRIVVAVLLTALLFALAFVGRAMDIPTLFVGEEAWYGDAMSPLIVKNGVLCVPVKMLEAFDHVRVRMARSDNVLLENPDSGRYLSASTVDSTAVVDGQIIETTVFEENDTIYVDAQLLAEVLDLLIETNNDDGVERIRLCDGYSVQDFHTILERYTSPTPQKGEQMPEKDNKKRIYILCEYDSGSVGSVVDALNAASLSYTPFLTAEAGEEQIRRASAGGEYGISAPASELNQLNDRFRTYSYRCAHAVMTEETADLEETPFCRILWEFTVGEEQYAPLVLEEIRDYLETHDYCAVYLRASWNATEAIRLFRNAEWEDYRFLRIGNEG